MGITQGCLLEKKNHGGNYPGGDFMGFNCPEVNGESILKQNNHDITEAATEGVLWERNLPENFVKIDRKTSVSDSLF